MIEGAFGHTCLVEDLFKAAAIEALGDHGFVAGFQDPLFGSVFDHDERLDRSSSGIKLLSSIFRKPFEAGSGGCFAWSESVGHGLGLGDETAKQNPKQCAYRSGLVPLVHIGAADFEAPIPLGGQLLVRADG